MHKFIYPVLIAFLFNACSTSEPEIKFEEPKIQVPKPQPEPKKNKGSLYSMEGTSLFADKKDLQVGDIIQINIDENLTSNTNNKRELSNDRNSSLGGGILAGTGTNTLGATAGKLANKFNRNLGVDFSTQSTNSDSGEVKTSFAESFSTSISAIIQQTYQNGNYYIKGSKELLIDGQKQVIIITGVIRPYDISSENSISSNQIANLKLMYDKEGTEADIMETPWGIKLMRAIWPF
ncbi:flagellar basal body L-ring protein FlgH [Arcobacter sp. YIC-464]|uniref:flagellar basal body L-ring protein FlgH n=1 Tax=Arcobacter sp. YIC-464 TaxID=3376631 RepID=UPI003C21D664